MSIVIRETRDQEVVRLSHELVKVRGEKTNLERTIVDKNLEIENLEKKIEAMEKKKKEEDDFRNSSLVSKLFSVAMTITLGLLMLAGSLWALSLIKELLGRVR